MADIEVAKRDTSRGAAVLGLLDAALDYLVCQIPRVKLGNRTHNPMQQQTRRCLVDILADRHQLGPGLLERQVDRHVIGPVARQAVNLVDDDIFDGVFGDELQEALEFRAVSGLGRLATLHELFNDGGVETGCLALAAFSLGRDGEALGFAALLGLFLGGDSHINHGRGSFGTISFLCHCHRLPPFLRLAWCFGDVNCTTVDTRTPRVTGEFR
ncbi:MAG: hypothetical protein WA484_00905 [Solirubrobacteraceae bacterium]